MKKEAEKDEEVTFSMDEEMVLDSPNFKSIHQKELEERGFKRINRWKSGNPSEWVDKILKDGVDNWIPPINKLDANDYDLLLKHHLKETDILYAVIREMVRRLKKPA